MNKMLLAALALASIAGCGDYNHEGGKERKSYPVIQGYSEYRARQVTDADTCVIYFTTFAQNAGSDTLTIRVGRDGKPLLNAQCVKEKGDKHD